MASPPPPFQVEDQTDEDFFDKLVNDDDDEEEEEGDGTGIHSASNSQGTPRAVSNLSLGDVDDSVSALEAEFQKNDKPVESSETYVNAASISEVQPRVFSKEASGGSKGTGIKEVQWSVFSADSLQFGQGGFDSDLFLGSDGGLVESQAGLEPKSTVIGNTAEILNSSVGHEQHDAEFYSSVSEQGTNSTEVHNWENVYPGWKYDPSSGQWYQLDGYDATANAQSGNYIIAQTNSHEAMSSYNGGEAEVQNAFNGSVTEKAVHRSYHSALETITEESSLPGGCNQVSQGIVDYPSNMVFDPQYPEWYYDTIAQQWYTLESYKQALSCSFSGTQAQYQANVNVSAGLAIEGSPVSYGGLTVPEQSSQESNTSATGFGQKSSLQEQINQESQWNVSASLYDTQSQGHENSIQKHRMWQPESHARSGNIASLSNNQLNGSFYGSMEHTGNQTVNQFGSNTLEPTLNYNFSSNSSMTTSQGYLPPESMYHSIQPNMKQSLEAYLSHSNYGTDSSINYTQAAFQGVNSSYPQFSYTSNEQRSSAGRPPHALVAFGFGGKIMVMKDIGSSSSSFATGSQGNVGVAILVHSLADIVMPKMDSVNIAAGGGFGYFPTLCQQSFPGPLVGGNAATKDVNKWIDDRIMNSKSSSMDFQNNELLRLLLSLLKVLCQHYGKLRSPYGVDSSLEGNDGPESSVSKLFASSKREGDSFGGFGSFPQCMKNLPVEGQIRSTAIAVQNLLVSGRRKEALQCAQDGHLWGPALVLAAQLGEQLYIDTVKQMAHRQFVCGSPLRTLCLLIAGQPADVFSVDSSYSGLSGAVNGPYQSSEILPNSMLDDWQENLAIITSNRTKDDELVIIHLGDCLWKERGEVIAAHTCYLVAEANIESYSDIARLCLIGADHWKNPRTYACPDAIQRTEIYEYSKVIGNSQFVLLPFQPYKLIYAYMLAEVGKVSDSLKYCQASMKLLKNSGRSPEVELWRTQFSSLEERLRIHQQGGYGTNLATTKLVGKLINSIDRSIHRMMGAPPLPPMPQNSGDNKDNSMVPKVSSSQSTMAITSLVPSASVESMNEWVGDSSRKVMHNRSVSEPDFGRSSKQNSAKDGSLRGQVGGPSRFGRFGSQLLQKTIGLVSWTRQDRQAKLGESNKFYYDEKLKRWVEDGAELSAAEADLPPPPTLAALPNGTLDYDINSALKSNSLASTPGMETKLNPPSEQGSGIPPMPPSQNQFSAHGRIGVRSRYVDTFNKGGGSFTTSFLSTQSVKPQAGAKFFVPAAPVTNENPVNIVDQETSPNATTSEEPSTSSVRESIISPPSASSSLSSMPRFPSMDNISLSKNLQSSVGSLTRTRAASWSGTYTDASTARGPTMEHSLVGSSVPSTFSPPYNDPSHIQSNSSSSVQMLRGSSESDDLHEVQL
ncbi:hypothetical protein AXF42_Ash006988 [Apostasia shenzhenica]|uniref:Protein transport protein sec16 n=1 Tax=Apostasia shenzhenica TaxID=1088818 RepID=A0A2I0BER5_9ASPA|nr:hypothetical protein AXF42_Ash006988 [Apostasia shenzhenica]